MYEILIGLFEVVFAAAFLYGLYVWTHNENANLIRTGSKDGRKEFERE